MPTVTEEMKMRVGYSRTDEHGFLERGDQVAIADAYESRDLGTPRARRRSRQRMIAFCWRRNAASPTRIAMDEPPQQPVRRD